MSYLSNLSPQKFEDFCYRLLQAQGFVDIQAEFSIAPDIRADFIARDAQGKLAVIEIKQTRNTAAINSVLFQVSSFQKLSDSARAIIIISGKVPGKARKLSVSLNIEIWDEEFIQNIVQHHPELFEASSQPDIIPGQIRLTSLQLSNFRGIQNIQLNLSSPTVLVGRNGAGKSTVLDALAIALSWFCRRMTSRSANGAQINESDIRIGATETSIQLTALIEGSEVTWEVAAANMGYLQTHRSNYRALTEKVSTIRDSYSVPDRPLPVVAHYSVQRAVQASSVVDTRSDTGNRMSELYRDAIGGNRQDFKAFFEWFRKREDLENEKRVEQPDYRDVQIETVRAAILKILDEFSDLRIERSDNSGRMVAKKGSDSLDISQLSDGEKCMLGMVGDLARRLAIANPSNDEKPKNPLLGSGVVLIDEIELHLHPQLQREIIGFLTETFPNCQFIISTHSAPVISHIDSNAVLLLSRSDRGLEVENIRTFGQDVNRILHNIFGTPERPPEILEKMDRSAQLIDAEQYDEATCIVDELAAVLGEDDPDLVYLKMSIRFSKTDEQDSAI